MRAVTPLYRTVQYSAVQHSTVQNSHTSPESFLGPEHTEHHVVPHHIKVPRDDGALVRVLDQNLVDLHKKLQLAFVKYV